MAQPLRILLTNEQISFGGSETYLFTLAQELLRRGHQVDLFSPHPGVLTGKFNGIGVPTYDVPLLQRQTGQYDVIHAQHQTPTAIAMKKYPNTPVLYVSHGVIPPPELPPAALVPKIGQFVAISEEVRNNLVRQRGIPPGKILMIPNGVDTGRFAPRPFPPLNPFKVLILGASNFGYDYAGPIAEALARLLPEMPVLVTISGAMPEGIIRLFDMRKVPYRHIGTVWNVEDHIAQNHLVIGLGRCVLESMSAGRPVIIAGRYGVDGLVTRERINELQKNNFSGRRFAVRWAPEKYLEQFKWMIEGNHYETLGKDNRALVMERYDIAKIASQLETLYHGLAGR